MSLRQLQNATDKTIARSSSSPPTNINADAKVVSVHDGDTCDLVFIRNGHLERFKCRLVGIDAPELKDDLNRPLKARDFLAWLSLGNAPASFPRTNRPWSDAELQSKLDVNKELVYTESQGIDYYQRPLVTLRKTSSDKSSFNDLLMQNGYAKAYIS